MLGDERRVVGAQELPADREPAVAADLFDARLLQQVERRAARADEDEARVELERRAADLVAELSCQSAVLALPQTGDPVLELELRARPSTQSVEQQAGERAEVDVGAGGDAGGRDRLDFAAARDEQRRPRRG